MKIYRCLTGRHSRLISITVSPLHHVTTPRHFHLIFYLIPMRSTPTILTSRGLDILSCHPLLLPTLNPQEQPTVTWNHTTIQNSQTFPYFMLYVQLLRSRTYIYTYISIQPTAIFPTFSINFSNHGKPPNAAFSASPIHRVQIYKWARQ